MAIASIIILGFLFIWFILAIGMGYTFERFFTGIWVSCLAIGTAVGAIALFIVGIFFAILPYIIVIVIGCLIVKFFFF